MRPVSHLSHLASGPPSSSSQKYVSQVYITSMYHKYVLQVYDIEYYKQFTSFHAIINEEIFFLEFLVILKQMLLNY